MNRRRLLVLSGLGLAGVLALALGSRRESAVPAVAAAVAAEMQVESGALDVWSTYSGRYESRLVHNIASACSGPATLIELAADGAVVRAGDVLARLDSNAMEAEISQKEEALTTARGELERLQSVTLPSELQDLEVEIALAEDNATKERDFLHDSERLVTEGLLSAQELEQQRRKLRQEEATLAALREKQSRLKQFDRPARSRMAEARVHTAERALHSAREQLQKAVIRAPAAGIVMFEPIQVSSEFRVVRTGDSVNPSQTFMLLTGSDGMQARFDLPETELRRVSVGLSALVQPLGDAGSKSEGTVSRISATAQTAPGYPVWQRFFQVTVDLPGATGAQLRPGSAAVVHILSFQRAQAILVPRPAVEWADGSAFVEVREGSGWRRRRIQVGVADALRFEVVEGLKQGDVVRVPR